MNARNGSLPDRWSLFTRLPWWLGGQAGRSPRPRLPARLETIERRLDDLASTPPPDLAPVVEVVASLREALSGLDKQVGRLGREQFKANALAEAQAERQAAALERLDAATARQATDLAAAREQVTAAQTAARLDLVRAILPTLDGLDEALRIGHDLLAARPGPPSPTLLERLVGRPAVAAGLPPAAMAAWLDGLALVRQRLLDTLAAEDVHPIAALDEAFEPHQHVVLEVVPASAARPPGTVAAELRRGYRVGSRVLRPAEVAVTKE